MYTNAFGCDNWLYTRGRYYDTMALKLKDNCNQPKAWGWISIVYFVTFCVVTGQVLMTLFIGIIATAMEESTSKNAELLKLEQRAQERIQLLKFTPVITCTFRSPIPLDFPFSNIW